MKTLSFNSTAVIGDTVSFDGESASPKDNARVLSGFVTGRVVGVTLASCGATATSVWLLVEVNAGLYEIEDFEAALPEVA
jgi:hypothetical protein